MTKKIKKGLHKVYFNGALNLKRFHPPLIHKGSGCYMLQQLATQNSLKYKGG